MERSRAVNIEEKYGWIEIKKLLLKTTPQKIGLVLQLIGLTIFILAIMLDFIGLGAYPGYGYKQIIGVIVGAIAINAGEWLKR
jgi:uncharacterized membrane protein